MIYADNAATTKLDIDAFEAMKPFLLEEYANASQLYSFSRKVKNAIRDARATIAACISALPEEIFFTSGGTESDNWAIKGTVFQNAIAGAITSQIEHHAVLNACAAVERRGVSVVYLPVDVQGIVHLESLQNVVTDNCQFVSIMYANNEVGTIQPIRELCAIAHQHNAIFHTDAVQAVGHVPINVHDLGVDMLSASAHKFNGMKGVGFLYIRKGLEIERYSDGGMQEFGMRAGTENVAGIVAMAAALKKNCDCLEEYMSLKQNLKEIVLGILSENNVDFINNGAPDTLPGILSISFRNSDGERLLHRLDLMGVCISTGAACDSKNTKMSHVLEAMRISPEYAKGTIRISLGNGNTENDAVTIANALVKILKS
jgi:cysteine desulfurase